MATSVLRPRQRDAHIGAPAADLAHISAGGASFWPLLGGHSSGTTRFLNWVPATAMAHQFVVTHAALMKNPALRTPPGGGVVAVDG